jgi:hypothetical protein
MLRRMAVAVAEREQPASWRLALATCRHPANLRRTIRIALVVGTILTLINQADVIVRGNATGLTVVKVCLNFVVPFIVSNLGVLTGSRTARR